MKIAIERLVAIKKRLLKGLSGFRLRSLIIISVIIIAFVGIPWYFLSHTSGANIGSGQVRVPNAPKGDLNIIDTSSSSPEYLRVLDKSNRENAERALKTGDSNIPYITRGSMAGSDDQEIVSGTTNIIYRCCPQDDFESLLNAKFQSGELSGPTQAALLNASRQNNSIGDVSTILYRESVAKRIKPALAKELLTGYRKSYQSKNSLTPSDVLDGLVAEGKIAPHVSDRLKQMIASGMPKEALKKELDKMVAQGLISPEAAQRILTSASKRRSLQATRKPENDTEYPDISGLSRNAKRAIKDLHDSNPSLENYKKSLNDLVKRGVITPKQREALLQAYREKRGLTENPNSEDLNLQNLPEDVQDMLKRIEEEALGSSDYADRLDALVKSGKITPQQAKSLLRRYLANHPTILPENANNLDRLAAQHTEKLMARKMAAYDAMAAKSKQTKETQQSRSVDQQSKAIAAYNEKEREVITTQVQNLLKSWTTTPNQASIQINVPEKEKQGQGSDQKGTGGSEEKKKILIKAGTILFAVLDTGINSDRPAPIMATITLGKFKKAKLIGSIQRTTDNNRLLLRFTQMTMPDWDDTISISALALDPETARSALATSIDKHYVQRYLSLFASSFLNGYANFLANAKNVEQITPEGKKTVVQQEFSKEDAAMAGLGEVGKAISSSTKAGFNRLPTITIRSGVGIAIFFDKTVIPGEEIEEPKNIDKNGKSITENKEKGGDGKT